MHLLQTLHTLSMVVDLVEGTAITFGMMALVVLIDAAIEPRSA